MTGPEEYFGLDNCFRENQYHKVEQGGKYDFPILNQPKTISEDQIVKLRIGADPTQNRKDRRTQMNFIVFGKITHWE